MRRPQARGTRALVAALVIVTGIAGVGCGDGGASGGDELTLEAVSPDRISARGGDSLTIQGRGFRAGATVHLGDTRLTVLETTDATLIATAPLLVAGSYDLTVTNPDGEAVTLPEAVSVLPLNLSLREAAAHYLPDLSDAVITGMATGDVDGDGDTDVVLGVSAGQSQLVLNSGLGEFFVAGVDSGAGPGLPLWEQDTREIILADLDGDGDLDLFGCSGSGEANRLFYNDGTGRFREVAGLPQRVGSCLHAVATDLDGDGLPEIAVVAAKEGVDATQFVRVYRNRSVGSDLRFELDAQVEAPLSAAGGEVGSTWAGGDPSHSASFLLSSHDPAVGTTCGEAGYDFAGVDGYALFYLPAPGIRFVPDELRLRFRGDGSGHRLTLRVRDASGERFVREVGAVVETTWQTMTVGDVSAWDHFGGNDDGVIDLPLDRVTVQLDRVAGGPESGAVHLDQVELWHGTRGVALVEDFERVVQAHGVLGDVFSAITSGDLDGDGDPDLVLTATSSVTGDYLRVLSNQRESASDGDVLLWLQWLTVTSPLSGVAFPALMDLEADGDADVLLLTVEQDRIFINDGGAHFFDDSVSLLPVDRVDGRHAAVGDLNLDGLPDVVIANHGEANRLYLGAADGRLLDHTPTLGLHRASSRRVAFLDADGDGLLDVMVVNDDVPRLQLFVSEATGGE